MFGKPLAQKSFISLYISLDIITSHIKVLSLATSNTNGTEGYSEYGHLKNYSFEE